MIGNPTRVGDLAVVIGAPIHENNGLMVEVIGIKGCRRDVKILGPAFHGYTGQYEIAHPGVVASADDRFLQPIRPPAPEEQDERAEHLVGVV